MTPLAWLALVQLVVMAALVGLYVLVRTLFNLQTKSLHALGEEVAMLRAHTPAIRFAEQDGDAPQHAADDPMTRRWYGLAPPMPTVPGTPPVDPTIPTSAHLPPVEPGDADQMEYEPQDTRILSPLPPER
jgi:hypothetical protein